MASDLSGRQAQPGKWGRLTFCFVCVLLVISAWSTSRAEVLLGVPFLNATGVIDREVLRTEINKSVLEQLSEHGKNKNWEKYNRASFHKALAIAYIIQPNPFVPEVDQLDYIKVQVLDWYAEWEDDNLEGARNKVMDIKEGCRSRESLSGKCIMYFEDDSAPGIEPLIDEYLEVQKKAITDATARFNLASHIDLIDNAVHQLELTTTPYALAPNEPIIIGNPDRQQDYADRCQHRIFYTLRLLASQDTAKARSNLQQILGAGLYGPYLRSINTPISSTAVNYTESAPGRRMTHQMHFTILREGSQAQFTLPPNLSSSLSNQKITKIWLEGSVRTTADGRLPLAVDELMRPLAIETPQGLYVGVEIRMPRRDGECYVGHPFSNEVMRVQTTESGRANRVLGLLLDGLRSELAAQPLSAEPIMNEQFAPGEFGMVRNEQPSMVLGAPDYERSTYLVQTWSAGSSDPYGSLYSRQDFQGIGEESLASTGPDKRLAVFLKVTHIFTRASHRLGEYQEPSREEAERYELEIKKHVFRAITNACSTLGWQITDGICSEGSCSIFSFLTGGCAR